MNTSYDFQALLLDIEGTTTPVSFVFEVLFPYAQRELQRYLEAHWDDPAVQQDMDEMVAYIAGLEGDEGGLVPHEKARPQVAPRDETTREAFRASLIEHIRWQMDEDLKNPPLKALQGRIWRAGYDQGELKAPVYPDVVRALERCQARGIPVYIYSSGSVDAQKLLFGFSDHGDLTGYLSGYFDTHTGPKRQAESYTRIAAEIGRAPQAVLFVTDVLAEAQAAQAAGMRAVIASRPGNAEQPEHTFQVLHRFDEILAE